VQVDGDRKGFAIAVGDTVDEAVGRADDALGRIRMTPGRMSRRRRHLVQAACAALLVVIGVGLVRLVERSDAAEVRYAANLRCLYDKVYGTRGPVSIASFGTSRTKWGFSPTGLARGLNPPRLEHPILNEGRSFRGTDLMYQQLPDVAAERGVTQAVIVEVALPPEPPFRMADSPFAYDYYRNFSGAVTMDRLLADLSTRPSEPLHRRLRDLGEQLRRRVDLNVEDAVTGRPDRNVPLPPEARRAGTRHGDCSGGDRRHRPRAIRADEAERVPPGTAWSARDPITTDFDNPLWERELHSLRQFRAWGEEHDVPVVFALVLRRVDPLVDPSVPRRFEERWARPSSSRRSPCGRPPTRTATPTPRTSTSAAGPLTRPGPRRRSGPSSTPGPSGRRGPGRARGRPRRGR